MEKPQSEQLSPFDPGAKWKHKRQGLIYFIQAKGSDGDRVVYTLGLFDPHHQSPAPFPTNLTWTAEEITREFLPVDRKLTRYDRLMLEDD